MKAIEINQQEITEEYMRENGLVFMDYYRWRVLGTREQVIDFAREGMMCCEGAERERLTDIYLEATSGALLCRDWSFDGSDPYGAENRKVVSWDVFQAA